MYEGSIWESALLASHKKLDNLIVILDRNNKIILGDTEDCVALDPIEDKWKSFNWDVHRVDGHNMKAIMEVLQLPLHPIKPRVIIADTVKGKGVSFMEGKTAWHGVAPSLEDYEKALKELV